MNINTIITGLFLGAGIVLLTTIITVMIRHTLANYDRIKLLASSMLRRRTAVVIYETKNDIQIVGSNVSPVHLCALITMYIRNNALTKESLEKLYEEALKQK